jgi:hypothetical protein
MAHRRMRDGRNITEAVPYQLRRAALRAPEAVLPGIPVADIVFDSFLDDPAFDYIRRGRRLLRFWKDSAGLSLDVTVTMGLHLGLNFEPQAPVAVEIRTRHRRWILVTDDRGRCTVNGIHPQLVSFVGRWQHREPIQTAWFRL